jgi:hypothetical protein
MRFRSVYPLLGGSDERVFATLNDVSRPGIIRDDTRWREIKRASNPIADTVQRSMPGQPEHGCTIEYRKQSVHASFSRGGLDHRHDTRSEGIGQRVPGVDDGGQVRVSLTSVGGHRVGNQACRLA